MRKTETVYCCQCDSIKVSFEKDGFFDKGKTTVEFMQGNTVLQTLEVDYPGSTGIHIRNIHSFVTVPPPETYTINDLMKLIEEKKAAEDKR